MFFLKQHLFLRYLSLITVYFNGEITYEIWSAEEKPFPFLTEWKVIWPLAVLDKAYFRIQPLSLFSSFIPVEVWHTN